ncbi:MAG: type III-B CRISPR module RAMP protein Cmr1 [Archaeoglobales archaeon]|nr:type III-B CRISPR module RAMP protein Cmr1 [Archaeoglobales archaeon]
MRAELETVTPLFLAGANQREPELRAPSFRGVMRFWLRALLGGVLGNNPQEIFKHESAVFGSTEHASPVIVRVRHLCRPDSGEFDPLPHRKESKKFTFKGFIPDQNFTLTLLSRDEGALEQAAKALQLLCLLGGLGRRSRRGFGSLQIVNGDLPKLEASTTKELSSRLKEQLEKITGNKFASVSSTPSFPILHPWWTQIRVYKKEFGSWEEAIRFVMEKAHEHRNPSLGWAGGKEKRQASPIHVHVTKLTNGKYALVLTTLLSKMNPSLGRVDRGKLVAFLNAFEGEVVFGFKEVPEKWPTGNVK